MYKKRDATEQIIPKLILRQYQGDIFYGTGHNNRIRARVLVEPGSRFHIVFTRGICFYRVNEGYITIYKPITSPNQTGIITYKSSI